MLKVYTGLAGGSRSGETRSGEARRGEAWRGKAEAGEKVSLAKRSPLLRFIACRDVIEKVADNGAICMRFE